MSLNRNPSRSTLQSSKTSSLVALITTVFKYQILQTKFLQQIHKQLLSRLPNSPPQTMNVQLKALCKQELCLPIFSFCLLDA